MKIKILAIGKTDNPALSALIATYEKRLQRYVQFELVCLPDLKNTKNLSPVQQQAKEGGLLLKYLKPGDHLVVLDERGKEFRSVEFSRFLQKKMNAGLKQLIFCIGGPYGFSAEVYQRANERLALSKMTFSHQMVRLFAIEQVYRGFTILKNEPYHHE
jgi:23S rRNA (pseudouridine1915-N3)-methyltransferase